MSRDTAFRRDEGDGGFQDICDGSDGGVRWNILGWEDKSVI